MSENNALVPVEVRAPRGGDTVEIDWADGHHSRYSNALLRGYCPCAGCQGHSGTIAWVEPSNTELAEIEEVGNYGLGLTWADGHATGIYTYRYLRELCGCERCFPDSARARHEPLPR
jgi:DUF971 family protein